MVPLPVLVALLGCLQSEPSEFPTGVEVTALSQIFVCRRFQVS